MEPSRILIVEDEAIVALDLKLQLQDLGYTVAGIGGHVSPPTASPPSATTSWIASPAANSPSSTSPS
jgi:CheY-like chemotaxis protein